MNRRCCRRSAPPRRARPRAPASAACLLLLLAAASAHASPERDRPAAPTVTPRVVELPGLRIDPAARTLQIRGWFVVTSPRVALEYLLSTQEGKLHETLIATECSAEHLMLGLILLGLEPDNELQARGDPRPLRAPRLRITARWRDEHGVEQTAPVESLLYDLFARSTMPEVGWAFTGSRFVRGSSGQGERGGRTLAADVSGGLIAVYHDPDAVLDNPLLVGGDVPIIVPTFERPEVVRILPGDERYVAYPERVPARGTAVTLTARPLAPPSPANAERKRGGR